jgi:hypothetical protein
MKFLKNYFDYLITESVLMVSDSVVNILSKINSKISTELFNIINNQQDIDTLHNILDVGEKNDELLFIPDNRAQKLLDDGEKPFVKTKQAMGVGRLVRSILTKNKITFTDKELEEFVTEFKAQHDIINGKSDNIKIVTGDDIKYWYDVDNYKSEGLEGTELGNSCMRYSKCQKYFDIYTKNPNQCRMVIYLEGDKLIGRALLWKISNLNIYYMDRIYVINNSDKKVMMDWVLNNVKDRKIAFYQKPSSFDHSNMDQNSYSEDMEITLDNSGEFTFYPYMDTFDQYDYEKLTTRHGDITLNSTSGSYEGSDEEDGVWCEFEGQYFGEDEVRWSDYHDVYIYEDNAQWSDYHDSYLWTNDANYLEYRQDYVHHEHCVYSEKRGYNLLNEDAHLVYFDIIENLSDTSNIKNDYFHIDDLDELYRIDEYGLDKKFYYSIDLFEKYGEKYLLKKYATKCYVSTVLDISEELANPSVSELDAKVFDIKVDTVTRYEDLRNYYTIKFKYKTPEEWLEMVKNLKCSEEIKNKKLKEIAEYHQYIFNNSVEYKNNYRINIAGGKEKVLEKWANMVKEWKRSLNENIEKHIKKNYSWEVELLGKKYTPNKDIEHNNDFIKMINLTFDYMCDVVIKDPNNIGNYYSISLELKDNKEFLEDLKKIKADFNYYEITNIAGFFVNLISETLSDYDYHKTVKYLLRYTIK